MKLNAPLIGECIGSVGIFPALKPPAAKVLL